MITFIHGFLGLPRDFDEVRNHLPLPSRAISIDDPITQPTILVGYSMGGRVALQHAKNSPHLVQKVICLSTNPNVENRLERKKQDEQWLDYLDTHGLDAFLNKWYAQPLFKTLTPPPWRAHIHPETIKEHLRKYSVAIMPPLDLQTLPAHFLVGELDKKYVALGKKLGARVVPGCGHAIHLENPYLCAQFIQSLVNN